ncbi:sugar ABC transporter permease [Anaerosphaera multitolerans]|uniref:Sugar ABC transporter permease n=2 Tax=Anaerosphaera multitolerans TaxID=2487351 RepID=A0A437SAN8_9FIRM|nr:sugar ABC transporter permease [Anaerosphaera multitolerans]
MVSPAIIILAVFVLYPIGYMVYLSGFEWNLIGEKVFIGLGNFKALFTSEEFLQVVVNTMKYTFYTVFFSVGIALMLAEYLKESRKINSILQGIIFTPYVIPLISIAFIWMWLMDSDYGLLNYLLEVLEINSVKWLEDPKIALNSIILVSVWKGVGYNVIILLSAMHAVPKDLYEAANLDRASKQKVFFKITMPMISPSIFFLVLMNIISSFKVFETVSIMTQGGPMNSTNTLVFNLYEYGFKYYKIGYASAMGVVLMGLIGICTILYFWALSKKVHYQ